MSILTKQLPTSLIIGGKAYAINTDHRTSIEFEELLNNKTLEDKEIWDRALNLYYPIIPQDLSEAIQQMLWFYRCGKELKQTKENETSNKDEIYSFEYDGDSICSAFKEQYSIDLTNEPLHWWRFKAYFNSLNENTDIRKKMSIRATDINKLPIEQREQYKKLKKAYEIPKDEEEEEIDELDLALMNGEVLTGMI